MLNKSRIWQVVLGSMPPTKKFVLFFGLLVRSLVLRHDGWAPATLNSTCTLPCGPGPGWVGGTLYRATRGLSVGVMTDCDPVTRDATASATATVVVSVA